jgi:hypothetical protein
MMIKGRTRFSLFEPDAPKSMNVLNTAIMKFIVPGGPIPETVAAFLATVYTLIGDTEYFKVGCNTPIETVPNYGSLYKLPPPFANLRYSSTVNWI